MATADDDELRRALLARDEQIVALTDEVTQLRAAMAHRAGIEQAKGMIMATTGCDADAAFLLLVRQSQTENRKLREVAEALAVDLARRRPVRRGP